MWMSEDTEYVVLDDTEYVDAHWIQLLQNKILM
jgi:hypothetical protein